MLAHWIEIIGRLSSVLADLQFYPGLPNPMSTSTTLIRWNDTPFLQLQNTLPWRVCGDTRSVLTSSIFITEADKAYFFHFVPPFNIRFRSFQLCPQKK